MNGALSPAVGGRRGNHPVTIVLWAVMLGIVLLVSLAIFFSFKNKLLTDPEDAVCATQIRGHSTLTSLTNDVVTTEIDCPTKIVGVRTRDEIEAKEALAHEMASCWGKWGRGQISLFGRDEGMYCHVCAMVDIEGVDEISEFPQFLDQTEFKDGVTYGDYLTNGAGIPQVQPGWRMETRQPVAVVFTYTKGLTGLQRMQDFLATLAFGDNPMKGTVRGAGGGAVAGGAVLYGIGVAAGVAGSVIGAPIAVPGIIASSTIVLGAVTIGAATGFVGSMQAHPELNETGMVYIIPLASEELQKLGCQYAPVE